MFRYDRTFINLTIKTVNIKIKLENYDKELEADIHDYSLDLLENSRKLTDKILPFCANVEEIKLFSDALFQIVMEYDGINCIINIYDGMNIGQFGKNSLCDVKVFKIDQFDEFLEMFSKTPFYKRPEFIKVAIKG